MRPSFGRGPGKDLLGLETRRPRVVLEIEACVVQRLRVADDHLRPRVEQLARHVDLSWALARVAGVGLEGETEERDTLAGSTVLNMLAIMRRTKRMR